MVFERIFYMARAELDQFRVSSELIVCLADGQPGQNQMLIADGSGQLNAVIVSRSVRRGDVVEVLDLESNTSRYFMVTVKKAYGLTVGVEEVPAEEVLPHRDLPIGKGRVGWFTVVPRPIFQPVEEML